jgi:hypothetical protein
MKNKNAYNSFKKSLEEIKEKFDYLSFKADQKEVLEGEDVLYRGFPPNSNRFSIILSYNSNRPFLHVRVYEKNDANFVEDILKKNFPNVYKVDDLPQWNRWNINAFL